MQKKCRVNHFSLFMVNLMFQSPFRQYVHVCESQRARTHFALINFKLSTQLISVSSKCVYLKFRNSLGISWIVLTLCKKKQPTNKYISMYFFEIISN